MKYDVKHEYASISNVSQLIMFEYFNYAQKPPKFNISRLSMFE